MSSRVELGDSTFDMGRLWKVEFFGVIELPVRLWPPLEFLSADE